MKTNEQIIAEFREKIDPLFIPPTRAGDSPITDWNKYMSKEGYEHFCRTATDFILNLLKERDRAVREMIEGIDMSSTTTGGFRREVLSKLNTKE